MPPKLIDSPLPDPPATLGASVEVMLWLQEDGSVGEVEFIKGTKEWREAVIAAAGRWRFEPVMWEGKAIPARVQVHFKQGGKKMVWFNVVPVPNLPGEVHSEGEYGLSKPLIERDPDLILPLGVRALGKQVEAVLTYVVEEDGTTGRFEIQAASSEGAVRAALDLVAQREYQPAKIRERAVAYRFDQNLVFHGLDEPIAALKGAEEIVDPVYPYERALAFEEGYATVRFRLGLDGGVISAELVEASHPDFGGALIAAVESWKFTPVAASESDMREYRHDFVFVNTPYAARRLIDMAREKKSVSAANAGLDAKPKLLAHAALAYPTSLYKEKVVGSARIEFIIDRVGLAQVPRVLEATRPEFGWAAATLVGGMRFAPLTRKGKPAELRVILPVAFEPPNLPPPPASAVPVEAP